MTAPIFSASLAHILLSQSPRHAWIASPELNPAYREEESETFDLGTAAHAYLLEGETGFVILDFPDWRTKVARDTRDAARLAGKTPLLAHRWAAVQAMAQAAREQLAHHDAPIPLTEGIPESSLFWNEEGVECRATPDWHHHDHRTLDDYKTTAASSHPAVWSRVLWSNGSAIQAALYRRGMKACYGTDADFRFVVQENYPPYALAVIGLDPESLAFSDQQLAAALRIWKRCLETGDWPAYPTRTCYAEAPAYLQAQWLERTYYEVTP